MASPISTRKVLQDLGYAPSLNVPPVVPQPRMVVEQRNPNTAAIGQLIDSLGEFNQGLQAYGEGEYERSLDEAPDKAIALLKKAKEQTETSIQDYVSQSLITEGASPKVRQLTYNMIGERMAADDYNSALFGKRNRVAREDKPENPDDIIAETRAEFLQKLGDNIFIRAGADRVMQNADANFRSNARAEQDRLFENSVRENTGINIQRAIEGGFDANASPEAKSEAINQVFDYLKQLRQSGVTNPNAVFLSNIQAAALQMAQQQKYSEARELLDLIDGRGISDDKGNALGVYGSREDTKKVFTQTRAAIENQEQQNEARNENDYGKAQRLKILKATDAASNLISKAISDGRLYSPELEDEVRAAIESEVPGSLPGGNGVAILEGVKILNQYRNATSSSSPEAVLTLQNAFDKGDMETANAIINSDEISAQDKIRFTAEYNKAKGFGPLLSNGYVNSVLGTMQRTMQTASKAVLADGQEVIDELTSERNALMARTVGDFRSRLRSAIKEERLKGDLDNDTFAIDVLPGLAAKAQEEAMNKFNAEWRLIENRSGFGEVETGGKPLKLSAGIKNPSDPMFGSLPDSRKLTNLNTIADSVGKALTQSGGNLSLFDEKSRNILASMARKKEQYWPVVQDLGRKIAANPEGSEGLKSSYFNIRNRFGYTSAEVISGVSSEGVPLPTEEWQKQGLAFTTPMFANYKEFQDSYNSYKEIAKKLSAEDLTPEAKLSLEADESLNPLYQVAQKMGLNNDKAVAAFVKSQDKLLRALGDVAPNKVSPVVPAAKAAASGDLSAAIQAQISDSQRSFEAEYSAQDLDWYSQGNKVLARRDSLRKALFESIATKLGVPPEPIGDGLYSIPSWRTVASDPKKYDELFSGLSKEEQAAVYESAMANYRSGKQSLIVTSKAAPSDFAPIPNDAEFAKAISDVSSLFSRDGVNKDAVTTMEKLIKNLSPDSQAKIYEEVARKYPEFNKYRNSAGPIKY